MPKPNKYACKRISEEPQLQMNLFGLCSMAYYVHIGDSRENLQPHDSPEKIVKALYDRCRRFNAKITTAVIDIVDWVSKIACSSNDFPRLIKVSYPFHFTCQQTIEETISKIGSAVTGYMAHRGFCVDPGEGALILALRPEYNYTMLAREIPDTWTVSDNFEFDKRYHYLENSHAVVINSNGILEGFVTR